MTTLHECRNMQDNIWREDICDLKTSVGHNRQLAMIVWVRGTGRTMTPAKPTIVQQYFGCSSIAPLFWMEEMAPFDRNPRTSAASSCSEEEDIPQSVVDCCRSEEISEKALRLRYKKEGRAFRTVSRDCGERFFQLRFRSWT